MTDFIVLNKCSRNYSADNSCIIDIKNYQRMIILKKKVINSGDYLEKSVESNKTIFSKRNNSDTRKTNQKIEKSQ